MRQEIAEAASFVEGLPLEHPARAAIVESWQRCLEMRMSRQRPEFRSVDPSDLAERLGRSRALLGAARPVMLRLFQDLGGSSIVVYVTDAQGVVLDSIGPSVQLQQWRLLPGYDWSEAAMGTNGAGTCLVTGRPVIVAGPEHFLTDFENCTCTAAPIRAPDRRLVGALDISSTVVDAHPSRIKLVSSAADEIERILAAVD